MSASRIRPSDLKRMWEHSQKLMYIAAKETDNSEYDKIVEHLDFCIDAISKSIEAGDDLEFRVEDGGDIHAGLGIYSTGLTTDEIAEIKHFGWPNDD